MKVRRLLVLVAMTLALVACKRESANSLTGSYGSAMLAGTVVMEGDGTPEGVEVSVRDTGMATTLSADGKFVFAGVPASAVLDFRRADGIQASLNVSGSRSVVIELGTGGARRKGSKGGNSRQDKREFEGVITEATADSIKLFTSHKEEILIGLSEETVIRKGGETLGAEDLKVDMRVHVRARKAADSDDLVAQLVIVQQEGEDDEEDEEEKPEVRQYEGTIVRASATELVVFDSHRNEVTFVVNADTVVRKGNTTVNPADLVPGQRVHVKATVAEDGSATAVLVILQNTRETVSISGSVLGVSGTEISVKTKSGTWTVQTDAATRLREKGKAIGLSDISAGDSLTAKGKQTAANTILASEVEVRGKSGHP